MALSPASTDFIGAIRSALVDAGMLRDTIVILDPNTTARTQFDPVAGTGGEPTPAVVLGPRAAYVRAKGGREYTVQYIPEPGDPIITEGLVVRVLEGGENPQLVPFPIAVGAAPSGSIVALAKIEGIKSVAPASPWSTP